MIEDYRSFLIEKIRKNGNIYSEKGITFHLASSSGFCYGVDRSLTLAYETIRRFPGKRIFLTTEIIHNPLVNKNLKEMGVRFLSDRHKGELKIDDLKSNDVVILPAFGTETGMLNTLRDKGCILVDTICGSVLNVWRRVEDYARDGFTSIIHGRCHHEESVATSSRVLRYKNGKYLIILNMEEAGFVADYIRGGGDRNRLLKKFAGACSPKFDPDMSLEKIGIANQTTMLSSESLEIAGCLRKAMADRYGEQNIDKRFRNFDTICCATEDRQKAILELARGPLDLMIVIGGYNSSNTNHLCKIAGEFVPSFHIEAAGDLISGREIRHKPCGESEVTITEGWFPKVPCHIGITSGASTPDRVMEEVIEKILSCCLINSIS